MTETARLVIAVDSTQVSRADSALQKFGNTTSVVERQTDTLSSTVSRLAGPLAALTAGVSIKGLIDISDNYGQMADRIKMATDSTQEYVMVQDRLLQSANKTYRPLVEAQELYIRTADAIRSLGYETSDALDITDSFSYLLVTNAASADRASSAINAYSKAIQTGKVDSESWQSILAAMPSVVETLADELGRSSNEIRELGITGKLALSDLNEGLRRSVEETKAAADGMGVTLNDAIIRATNNWSTYLGESERVTSASRLMSGTLDTVSENLDTVASVASGVAVAAMARYSVALTQSTYASVSSAVSTARQASEELSLAQQQVASTATTLAKLRANYELTGVTTGLTAATIAHEQAEKRLAVAQTASVGLGRTALGLAGGWAGLAVTAGAVALSFVDWGDNAEEAARQSIALREETNLLTRAVQELDAAQAKQVLQRMADPYQAAKDEARNYAAQVEYLNMQIDRHPGSAKVDDWRRSLVEAEGSLSTVNEKLAEQEAKMRELNARIDENTKARTENKTALDETDATGTKYLAQLQRQADFAGKLTEVQRVNIAIEKGYAGVLSKGDKELALRNAALVDQANATKTVTKATSDSANAYQALYDRLYPAEAAQRQYNKELGLLSDRLAGDKLADAVNRLNFAIDGADATGPGDVIEDYRKELERLEDQLDPVGKATEQYQKDVERLNDAMERGERSPERTTELLAELERQYKDNTKATSDWAQWTEGALDRVDGAFADAWRNIGDGFSSFRDSLTDAFKQMLAELAHMAITKPIIMQIGAAMGIGGGTQGNNGIWGSLLGGGSASGGGAGGIGGALQQANQVRSLYSMYGAASSLWPALSGGYASGGFGGALSAGVSGIGGMFGLGSGAAASAAAGSTAAGYGGSAYASWIAAQGAGAGAAGAGGIGAGISGALSSMASMWYLAPIIGAWQSGKLYDQGVRPDASETWSQGGHTALGKISNVGPTFQSKFFEVLDSGLQKASFGLVDGKIAAMLSGSTFHQALWGGISKKLFGGAWETKDGGIALGATDGDLSAQQYIYQKKKGGLFSSSKKRTRYSALDDETAAMLQETYDATEAGVASLFESLSLSVESGTLAGLQLAREKISTKGKTEEEVSEAINEWFLSAADSMTAELNKVFSTGLDLDLAGMQAFVGNLQGVNEVIRYLDVSMYDMSVAGGKLAESLAAASGGLDALAVNSQTYYAAFFTEAEKIEDTVDSIKRAFESADVELVGSREAYRAMVEDIDLTTEAGQEMFSMMMALSGQAAQYFSIVEQQAAEALAKAQFEAAKAAAEAAAAEQAIAQGYIAAVNAAQSAFGRLQQSVNAEIQAAQSGISQLSSLASSLEGALRGMRLESDQFDLMRRRQAQSQLRGVLAVGRAGGSLKGVDLSDALNELGRANTDLFGSFEEYARDYWKTAHDINELNGITGDQLSVEEQAVEHLSGLLEAAQKEMDILMGIDSSVLSVAHALANFQKATSVATGTPKTNSQSVASAYVEVLGRSADADGLKFWTDKLARGELTQAQLKQQLAQGALNFDSGSYTGAVSLADIEASKKAAAQYLGIPGFAAGGFHSGGLRLVGEDGPELEVTGPSRIYNASQTAAMLGGGGNAETVAELRQLRADIRTDLRSIAKHTMKTAKYTEYLEHFDADGLPPERKSA